MCARRLHQQYVIGHLQPAREREAVKKSQLAEILLAEKRRKLALAGRALPSASDPPLTVAPEEYGDLVAAAYGRADLPKPLDDTGKPKVLPLGDMEVLLFAYMKVDDESMRELAQQRSLAVRSYLASKNLALDRLFVGTPKLATTEANWTPRAELELATR